MSRLALAQADAILAGAFAEARDTGARPLCVAVLDHGGNLVAVARQDGASILRPKIAIAKAAGALAMGMSSRELAVMAVDRPVFVTSLASLSVHGLVASPGGVIIVGDDGLPIAAVGVSGDTPDIDERCAFAGIRAAELRCHR
ncbi:heme-binding protein [Sphingomonas sp. So64.6b]|uniref:GlcG/HbpS family heme-binding protein n=1 Tax=Sphingomonas sp. So64.6b TaxID=2997354 RepID=UPI001602CA7C|nr:heme-binding protein [Sphingomonas sp. So64.6b]QNA85436.1 heme-binding protein [Sphingomonas sp. So64.6b]